MTLAPYERDASVLFSDLRGFTRLAERFATDPRGLLDILNEHLDVVVRAITDCGGTVEKFLGDGVLATFGAHQHQPDHRERAVAAAIGLVGANEHLNEKRQAAWGFRLNVAAGAATGSLVVGRIGPPNRWELGVLGDPINLASRLVARAPAGEVWLADSV